MTPASDPEFDALDTWLERSVAQEVEARIARAQSDSAARVQQARQAADALLEDARLDGEATAEEMLTRERAAVRRAAASKVLDAQQAVLTELRIRVRDAVLALRKAPDYPDLLNGLVERAHERIGSDADVVRDPDDAGGVIARQGGRQVDYTLRALADRALDLGDALDELWR